MIILQSLQVLHFENLIFSPCLWFQVCFSGNARVATCRDLPSEDSPSFVKSYNFKIE